MSPGAHLLISWLSGAELLKDRRERTIVALFGVAPDLDGLGVLVDMVTGKTNYFLQYHHYFGHSIFAALILAFSSLLLAQRQKLRVFILVLFVVHLHILCDVIGSRGPDGYQWPVYYMYPLLPDFYLTWQYQWELNAWPNLLLMLCLFIISWYYAKSRRITFLEVFSSRLNEEAFSMYYKYVRKSA